MWHRIPVLFAAGALGLSSCGMEGVSVSGPETTVGFVTGASSHGEDDGAIFIAVELTTDLNELPVPVSVTVSDGLSGTATSGADYEPFTTTEVVFPPGSTSGATSLVRVTALGDTLAEGATETLRLVLSDASGASLGGFTETELSLTDAETADVRFVQATSLTPDESTASYDLDVELVLSAGAQLAFDVDLVAVDPGTGTATSTEDYAAFAPAGIQFSAGTPSGTTRTVTVSVLDDAISEGPETVQLSLSGGDLSRLALSGPTGHALTIVDDEASPTPLFSASHGPSTGLETTLSSGDTIDLGATPSGGAATAGTLLVLANQGGADMLLGQPTFSGPDATDFSLEVEAASFEGGEMVVASMSAPGETVDLAAPLVRAAALGAPASTPRPGVEVAVDPASLADLAYFDHVRLHGFPVPGGGDVTLELDRIPLPVARDAVLAIDGAPVPGGLRGALADLSTWTGEALELPGSRVFLALREDGPEGWIELPFEDGRFIHLTTEAPGSGGTPATCRLVHEDDLLALAPGARPPLCAGMELAPGVPLPSQSGITGPGGTGPGPVTSGGGEDPPTSGLVTVTACRVAIETDWQFFQKFGNAPDATAYVTGLIAAISDVYFEHVQTTLSIAYLGLHSTSADPWIAPDVGASAGALLSEFRSSWNSSGWPASADLAHFMSGADLGGGVAYVNVLCSPNFAYGVSGNMNGNIDWGSWTGNPGSFTWDFVVVAHELGHNFGAEHTHEYCPPIDTCTSNCTGGTSCSLGTLMSYCHSCGGMNSVDLGFHPQVANIMRSRVDASCLGDATMQAGDTIQYRLRFAPRSGAGVKNATLNVEHDAANAPSPFTINVTGLAQ